MKFFLNDFFVEKNWIKADVIIVVNDEKVNACAKTSTKIQSSF